MKQHLPMLSLLQKQIATRGWLSFAEYMDIVLYTPGHGYYANASKKFGHLQKDGSDFVTAPELSPLFAYTLAQQLAAVMRAESFEHLLEIGAGSGQLAVDLLLALDARGVNVTRYAILELSASLRERQQEKIKQALQEKPHLLAKVVWLDQLPSEWCGIILGNEVLDAMPVNLYARLQGHWHERGVGWDATLQRLMWQDKILHQPQAILESISGTHDYITETHTMAEGFINSLSKILQRGVILLIDYGFPAAEYYHPQRCQGTLMAHYRHQAYTDPFVHPGEADLTAHINFSALADAADAAGLMLEGYTSQANFLMNAGLLDLLMTHDVNNPRHYLPTAKVAQQLLSEAEMGELFKVIAFSRHTSLPLCGFSRGDRSHTL